LQQRFLEAVCNKNKEVLSTICYKNIYGLILVVKVMSILEKNSRKIEIGGQNPHARIKYPQITAIPEQFSDPRMTNKTGFSMRTLQN